ncbi:MAG: hypothetical protein KDH92_13875, partial [Chloroflexi bacterium]|nr:hypothetical protein [Chloroflexota bacterium]
WLALGPAGDDPPTGVAHLAADGSLRVEGPAEGLTEPDVIALAAGPAGTLLALARRADGSTNALFERGPDGRWRQPALPRELAERMRFHHDDVDAFELRRIAIDAEGGWWLLAPGAVLRRTPDGVWDLLPRADEALAPAIEDGLWRALYTGSGAFATGADGTLWLGDPDGGLLRWARAAGWSRQVGDGDLPLRAANSLSVDRAGRPWLVGGRAWQLGRDARWRALEDPLDLDDLRCQDGDETAVVVARGPDGRLWIGDRGAVWQLAPDGTRLGRGSAAGLDVGRVLAIAFAPDGSAWVGGSEGLARQRPGGGWQTFGPRDGLPPGSVATLAFDARGQIWAGTRPDWRWDAAADGCVARGRGGLVTLPPGGGWTELALPPGLVEAAGDTINALLPDPQGGLLAAIGPRLYRRGPEGVWADRTAAVGLAARWPLRALAHDGAGNLWIGSDGDGARRVRPDGSWDAFGAGGGKLGDSVVALQAGPDGSMWFGLAYGGIDGARLARRRPDGSWTAYRQGWDAFWAHEIVSIALDDAGRIWCGTGQGRLYRLDEAEGFRVLVLHDALGQAEGSLFRLAPGEDGALWLASSEGLLRRDERGRLRTWQGADGLPSGVVSAVLPRPEGGAWAGFGWGTGAWRLEEGGGIGFVDAAGRYQDESEASGLADLQVGDLALGPGGRLLAALHAPRLRNERVSSLTGAGLALRDAAGDWRRVDRAAGLPSDELRAVAITPDGWLWAATDRGLAQSRDGAAWVTPGPAEGLSVTDVRALAVDADGSLWAGGADGLARREAVGRWRMLRRLGQPPEAVVDLALDPGGNAWLLVEQGPQRRSIAVRLRGAADRP